MTADVSALSSNGSHVQVGCLLCRSHCPSPLHGLAVSFLDVICFPTVLLLLPYLNKLQPNTITGKWTGSPKAGYVCLGKCALAPEANVLLTVCRGPCTCYLSQQDFHCPCSVENPCATVSGSVWETDCAENLPMTAVVRPSEYVTTTAF